MSFASFCLIDEVLSFIEASRSVHSFPDKDRPAWLPETVHSIMHAPDMDSIAPNTVNSKSYRQIYLSNLIRGTSYSSMCAVWDWSPKRNRPASFLAV